MNKYIKYFLSLLAIFVLSILSCIIVIFLVIKYQNAYPTFVYQNAIVLNNKVSKITGISLFEDLNNNVQEPIRVKKDLTSEFNVLKTQISTKNPNYSLYINDLFSNKIYLHNEKQNFYAASLYKIPIAVATLKQVDQNNINLNDELIYKSYHATIGTGFINESPINTQYSYDQLLSALLKNSDNTAQTMLQEKFNINSVKMSSAFPDVSINYSEDTDLGTDNTFKTNFYHINESNSYEIGEYLSYIYTSNYLSDESKSNLFKYMTNTEFDDYFANYLNDSFANKIGLSGSSIHNCGILEDKEIVVCIMSGRTNKNEFIEIAQILADFVNKL